MQYTPHPTADLFPMLDEEQMVELAADIEANGLREPIIVMGDQIIDGRNRFEACQQAGIEPTFVEYEGDEASIEAFVVSLNLRRRHLTQSQRAMLEVMVTTKGTGGWEQGRTTGRTAGSQEDVSADSGVGVTYLKQAGFILRHPDGQPFVEAVLDKTESVWSAHDALKKADKANETWKDRRKKLDKAIKELQKKSADLDSEVDDDDRPLPPAPATILLDEGITGQALTSAGHLMTKGRYEAYQELIEWYSSIHRLTMDVPEVPYTAPSFEGLAHLIGLGERHIDLLQRQVREVGIELAESIRRDAKHSFTVTVEDEQNTERR